MFREISSATPWPVFIFIVCIGVVFFYNAYLVWFQPAKFKARFVKQCERLPKWFPFREAMILIYSSPSFVLISRIIYLIGTLAFVVLFLTLLVYFISILCNP
jgi:hypothetical protein